MTTAQPQDSARAPLPEELRLVEMRPIVVGTAFRELVFIKIVTASGIEGVAEVRMPNKTDTFLAALRELWDRYAHGENALQTERIREGISRMDYGRPGEVAMSVAAAFDIACWDIVGQHLQVPVWQLLGGQVRDRIPAYGNGWYKVDRAPEPFAEVAQQAVSRGYRALKFDPFGAAWRWLSRREESLCEAIVAAVRDAVGPDVELMIEMHGRFSPDVAARIVQRLDPYDPAWFEEPILPENAEALQRVRAATNTPIATGERLHTLMDSRRFIELGYADILQQDLSHFGGFGPMKTLAGWAQAYYLTVAPHNVCGPVGTMANLHFCASTPNARILEHFNDLVDPWVHELVSGAPTVDPADGAFPLPNLPGLGVSLDEQRCKEFPPTGKKISLFASDWQRTAFAEAPSSDE